MATTRHDGPVASTHTARVVTATRRYVTLRTATEELLPGRVSSKALDVTAGDIVTYNIRNGDIFVESIHPRKNCIARSYRGTKKELAANLDLLLVVTAVTPLFNTTFIDRITTVAHHEDIPFAIILNKTDLGLTATQKLLDTYQRLEYTVIYTSAKYGDGLEELKNLLSRPDLHVIALSGISGVGKTTLLNRLIPELSRKTGEVSHRTGQGKQTTTQAIGYYYERGDIEPLLIIDLPGAQQFGVSHLEESDISEGYPEIQALRSSCEFGNCSHKVELKCAVRVAVEQGLLPISRYTSFLDMVAEIRENRRY